jgi:hypothetical protein
MSMSTAPTIVELEASGIRYFSPGDENAFFGWLDRLPFVEKYSGQGCTLYIRVNAVALDAEGLRELIALFRRYGIGLRQLAQFDRDEYVDWFRNKEAFWYSEIFG